MYEEYDGLKEFGHDVYELPDENTIVITQKNKDGTVKTWQLTCGNYLGECDPSRLHKIGRFILSD